MKSSLIAESFDFVVGTLISVLKIVIFLVRTLIFLLKVLVNKQAKLGMGPCE